MRCTATPGNRAMESAMLVSGSLPMSSALTTSTTEVDSLLVAIDVSIEWRMPVTTTSSSVLPAGVRLLSVSRVEPCQHAGGRDCKCAACTSCPHAPQNENARHGVPQFDLVRIVPAGIITPEGSDVNLRPQGLVDFRNLIG